MALELDEETVIRRARATLGSDAALDAVVTLRIVGSLVPNDPAIPFASLLIIARKPCSQRMEIKVDDIIETTILKGRQACIIRSNTNSESPQMRDLEGAELERVIYSTRQFFNFYEPNLRHGEIVRYEGIQRRFGQHAHKLKYSYPEGPTTIRYFSTKDHRLVSTISENGVENVGVGSQTIKGVKYPKSVEYYQGDRKIHTVVFKEIDVNKPLKKSTFRIPKSEVSQ